MHAKSNEVPEYRSSCDDGLIAQALDILRGRMSKGPILTDPKSVKDYLCLRAAGHEREVFGVVLLDAQHRLIETVDLFSGTLTQTAVYPREVVKLALTKNAAAVILTHNHPSGDPAPSRADEMLTSTLKSALALVDVRVLDHIITAGANSASFAERGLI